jgi:hypothetical protein
MNEFLFDCLADFLCQIKANNLIDHKEVLIDLYL